MLGPHATQAGSLVAPDRLRFDFAQMKPLRREQVREVEQIANEAVRRDDPVTWSIMPLTEAMASGAMALFGEKYGDEARVVRIGDFSRELCGGTHVGTTGQIGQILVTSEASVASGVRRIEALTGAGADAHVAELRETLTDLTGLLRTPEVVPAVRAMQERLRESERAVQALEGRLAGVKASELAATAQSIDGVRVLAARTEAASGEALKQMGDQLRDRLGTSVVVLGAVVDGRPSLLAMASRDAVAKGANAGALVRELAGRIGGGGGGRPDMAQAGGGDPARLDGVLSQAAGLVEEQLTK